MILEVNPVEFASLVAREGSLGDVLAFSRQYMGWRDLCPLTSGYTLARAIQRGTDSRLNHIETIVGRNWGMRSVAIVGAVTEGVREADLGEEYLAPGKNIVLWLQHRHAGEAERGKAAQYVQRQVGKPYNLAEILAFRVHLAWGGMDYLLKWAAGGHGERWICSQLLARAYGRQGFDVGWRHDRGWVAPGDYAALYERDGDPFHVESRNWICRAVFCPKLFLPVKAQESTARDFASKISLTPCFPDATSLRKISSSVQKKKAEDRCFFRNP